MALLPKKQRMSTTNKIIYAIVFIAVAALFILRGCGSDDVLKNVTSAKDTAYTQNVKGILAEYNKAVVLETQKQLKIVLASNDTLRRLLSKFKNATNTLEVRSETRIEKDTIPFLDTIPCTFTPKKVEKVDKNYTLYGKVDNKGFIMDSLDIKNKQSIVLGEVKKNFWGKTEQGVYIVNSNPLIKTDAIQNLTIVHKKKLAERPLFWAGVGTVAGAIIKSSLNNFKLKIPIK